MKGLRDRDPKYETPPVTVQGGFGRRRVRRGSFVLSVVFHTPVERVDSIRDFDTGILSVFLLPFLFFLLLPFPLLPAQYLYLWVLYQWVLSSVSVGPVCWFTTLQGTLFWGPLK